MRYRAMLTGCLLLVLIAAGCGGGDDPYDALGKSSPLGGSKASSSDVKAPVLTPDQGKNMINFKCTACHPNTRIKRARLSAPEWEARILRCKEKPGGAKIAPIEAKSLSFYLANKYRD